MSAFDPKQTLAPDPSRHSWDEPLRTSSRPGTKPAGGGMTIFEMVFNLIGLVLGLALVEVLGGLAKTIKSRPEQRVSWLTPLLGAWVVLDVSAFWGIAWEVRDLLTTLWPRHLARRLSRCDHVVEEPISNTRTGEACAGPGNVANRGWGR